ncbi:MAG: DUF374 domain-containing protein [Pseudomonadota bacterium]
MTRPVAGLVARYLRRVYEGTDWTVTGRDALAAEVQGGQPVILCLWHGRLVIAPFVFDPAWGRLVTLTSKVWPGRTMGLAISGFGFESRAMHARRLNRATTTELFRLVRSGASLGFAADGPSGPAHSAQVGLIDWMRLTGAPLWMCTYSVEQYRNLEQSWDRLVLPKRGGRGMIAYRRWEVTPPKALDADTREALRIRLQTDLDALTLETDRAMGHAGMIA